MGHWSITDQGKLAHRQTPGHRAFGVDVIDAVEHGLVIHPEVKFVVSRFLVGSEHQPLQGSFARPQHRLVVPGVAQPG